jgi:hypothetical protein
MGILDKEFIRQFITNDEKFIKDTKGKDIEIKLEPSDMLIYSGCELEHWRDEFRGDSCVQVFLHYNDKSHKEWEDNKYDGRLCLGLPANFKGVKFKVN